LIPEFVRSLLAGGKPGQVLVGCVGFDPVSALAAELARYRACRFVDLDQEGPGGGLAERRLESVVVLARTPTDVRRAATFSRGLPSTRHVLIVAVDAPADRSPPVPAPHPRWRTLEELQVRRLGSTSGWVVETRSSTSRPAGEVLAATAKALGGHALDAGPGWAAGLAGAGVAHWRPGDPNATVVDGNDPPDAGDQALPVDLVLRTSGGASPDWSGVRTPVIARPTAAELSWAGLGRPGIDRARSALPALTRPDSVPPIDERSVNPAGFVVAPELGTATLSQRGTAWRIRIGDRTLVDFAPARSVTDVDIAGLRDVRALRIEWGRHSGPVAAAHVVAGLAAAGVPMFAAHVPPWARCLGDDIVHLLTGTGEADLVDDLRREEHSIRLRRAALRTHSVRARWAGLRAEAGIPQPLSPPISVLLCTRRPRGLDFAFAQLARQRHVDVEVVLVLHGADSGSPEVRRAMAAPGHSLTVVEVPAAVPFGMALNHGAARASGRFIAKMDDDDWYGPEHLADLLLAREYSGADLVGCHNEFTYLEQIGVTVQLRGETERPHRQVAGAALFIERSALQEVGGFRPIRRAVDTHVQRGIEAAGGKIYRTHGLGWVVRRSVSGHTWDQPIGYFLRRSIRQWRGFRPSALLEAPPTPHPE
jgi:hypothetical protein